MATYSASNYTNNLPVSVHGQAGQEQTLYASITVSAALTTADVFNFGYLPPYARVISAVLKGSDMDTNGSPTLAINVGDAGDADRYFAASTVGQAGTVDRAMAVAGQFYKTTARTLVTGAPSTNAATGVAGTLELAITYVVEDQATTGS